MPFLRTNLHSLLPTHMETCGWPTHPPLGESCKGFRHFRMIYQVGSFVGIGVLRLNSVRPTPPIDLAFTNSRIVLAVLNTALLMAAKWEVEITLTDTVRRRSHEYECTMIEKISALVGAFRKSLTGSQCGL